MKADTVRENDNNCAAADSDPLTDRSWTAPTVTRLRAGLAETGPNANYDGVEGTS